MFISFVWGVFVRGVFGKGGFVQGVFVRGFMSGGFCPGGFCPGGVCPDTLRNTEMTTMRVRQMQNLCIEIYKTLLNLNPEHMHELFERNSHTYSTRRPNNLKIPRVNQTSFGSRSIRAEGAKLCNHLPENIKSSESLSIFQNLIKQWNGPSCGCNYCLFVNNYSSNIWPLHF